MTPEELRKMAELYERRAKPTREFSEPLSDLASAIAALARELADMKEQAK